MLYNNSTYCFENQLATKPCENWTILKNKVKYLLKTWANFTRGKENLEVVRGSQNCGFGKAEHGYNSTFKKKDNMFSSFISKSEPSDKPFISCQYCMMKVLVWNGNLSQEGGI